MASTDGVGPKPIGGTVPGAITPAAQSLAYVPIARELLELMQLKPDALPRSGGIPRLPSATQLARLGKRTLAQHIGVYPRRDVPQEGRNGHLGGYEGFAQDLGWVSPTGTRPSAEPLSVFSKDTIGWEMEPSVPEPPIEVASRAALTKGPGTILSMHLRHLVDTYATANTQVSAALQGVLRAAPSFAPLVADLERVLKANPAKFPLGKDGRQVDAVTLLDVGARTLLVQLLKYPARAAMGQLRGHRGGLDGFLVDAGIRQAPYDNYVTRLLAHSMRFGAAARAEELAPAYLKQADVATVRKPARTKRVLSEFERLALQLQPLVEEGALSKPTQLILLRRAGLLQGLTTHQIHFRLDRLGVADLDSPLDWDDGGGANTTAITYRDRPRPHTTEPEREIWHAVAGIGRFGFALEEVVALQLQNDMYRAFNRKLGDPAFLAIRTPAEVSKAIRHVLLETCPKEARTDFVKALMGRFGREVEADMRTRRSLLDSPDWDPDAAIELYQAHGIRRVAEAITHKSYLLLADATGLAKTRQVIGGVRVSGIDSSHFVAPKDVADQVWIDSEAGPGEIHRCLPGARIVRGMDAALADLDARRRHRGPRPLTFYVYHYEEFLDAKRVQALARHPIPFLCGDEIRHIKQRANPTPSKRRDNLQMVVHKSESRVGMDATPYVNELREVLSLFELLSKGEAKFKAARLSNRRLSDHAEVYEVILPHMLRRLKDDIFPDRKRPLIDITYVDLPADLERRLIDVHAMPASQTGRQFTLQRELMAEATLEHCLEAVRGSGPKVFFPTYHVERVAKVIADHLIANNIPTGLVTGRMLRGRQAEYDRFRSSGGRYRALVASKVAGEGISLTPQHRIVFPDPFFTWTEIDQMIGRQDRRGQTHQVKVDFPIVTSRIRLPTGETLKTFSEVAWAYVSGKKARGELCIDGDLRLEDASERLQMTFGQWLASARLPEGEKLQEPKERPGLTRAEQYRLSNGRLRIMSTADADTLFSNPAFAQAYLEDLQTSGGSRLSARWLRETLRDYITPETHLLDMGCGLNPLKDLPCHVTGLDRHAREEPGYVRGKMENPPLPDRCADILVYSLSLHGKPAELRDYFQQARRLIRPGGEVFVVEPLGAFTGRGLHLFRLAQDHLGFQLLDRWHIRGANGLELLGLRFKAVEPTGQVPPASYYDRLAL
ncbi:MAG: helicase-related protein [Myxococcaceae bacterium]